MLMAVPAPRRHGLNQVATSAKTRYNRESPLNIRGAVLRILAISLACAAVLFAAQPVFSAPLSRIVAVVNGDIITARELDKALQPELIGQQIDPKKSPDMVAAVRKAVLESMVADKIMMQQADKQGISISDEEVDAALAQTIAESGMDKAAFFKEMAKTGVDEQGVRAQIRKGIATQRIMARNVVSKVVVTEDEVNEYYRANMAGVAAGSARVAMLVYPPTVDAQKLAADIASGKAAFDEVCRTVSVGPNAADGGDMGFVELSDMAPGMLDIVSRMKKGEISPLIDLGDAKAQLALLDVQEAEEADVSKAVPDAETAARIEQILRGPRVQARFQEYTAELRAKALVDIRD